MAVDTSFKSLIENLKLEDPWLPPKPWEFIPSESGLFSHPNLSLSPPHPLYNPSSVTEASLVRLAMNALQGLQSSLVSIEKLAIAFCSDPADRTFHRLPNLWHRSLSTHSLGKILMSIGRSGLIVFLLRKFVDHFLTNAKSDRKVQENRVSNPNLADNQDNNHEVEEYPPYSVVNQAFCIAVEKVLQGYIGALDTLYASVELRRSAKRGDMPLESPTKVGCLTSILHSKITLLEVYLHTKELRSQVESLGNICFLHDVVCHFSLLSFEDLLTKATSGFCNFPRGGKLLTYLYKQLQVTDPVHNPVLKFLFLRSCEPYFTFIRSWIYKANISDPYKEFIVEYVDPTPSAHADAGVLSEFPLATIRERDGVSVPCFLRDFSVPLFRAGQQLQVIMKLFELCNFIADGDHTYEDILPTWSSFSGIHPSYASPLTFSKECIEALVLARNNFYTRMQEKLENLCIRLQIRYQQVVPHGISPFLVDSSGGELNFQLSDALDGSLYFLPKGESYADVDSLDSEACSTTDEFSDVVSPLESSEFSSVGGSEDEKQLLQPIALPSSSNVLDSAYLSALSFSSSTFSDKLPQKTAHGKSLLKDRNLDTCIDRVMPWGQCHNPVTSNKHLPSAPGELDGSKISETQFAATEPCNGWPIGSHLKNRFHAMWLCRNGEERGHMETNEHTSLLKDEEFRFLPLDINKCVAGKNADEDKILKGMSLSSSCPQSWRSRYQINFFSMHPMLGKNVFFETLGKSGNQCVDDHEELSSHFDFTSVEYPHIAFGEKSAAHSKYGIGPNVLNSKDSRDGTINTFGAPTEEESSSSDDTKIEMAKSSGVCSLLHSVESNKTDVLSLNATSGRSWESLLCGSGSTVNDRVEDKQRLAETFEVPLDFIIDKCLLQEIFFQYKYVSNLTIKLLEEGFHLQDHLLALRRYHFMESADWADLFIMSLSHQKWYASEANRRISEIQGFLELAVQKSSCEGDHNRVRLFVYMKKQGLMPLASSATGVHLFRFIGLGYRVDWPTSIILTPNSLEIYAEIFSFLMQVKLAIYSLTDVWFSLKDLMHLIDKNHLFKKCEQEMHHFKVLTRMRHQVYHFVSTLQQYVQSQLLHISWSRFMNSLKHEVKDMMDLETVHMAYLSDSLHICFLSDEMRFISDIIQSILQCAVDFRSCVFGGIWKAGPDQGDLLSRLNQINISQVYEIKKTFDANLRELHNCYLKSAKHGKFGISQFWGYLNYNEYYSDVYGETRGQCVFMV